MYVLIILQELIICPQICEMLESYSGGETASYSLACQEVHIQFQTKYYFTQTFEVCRECQI